MNRRTFYLTVALLTTISSAAHANRALAEGVGAWRRPIDR